MRRMDWFRTIPGFIRPLIALFLVAQLAGVVSSPAEALAIPNAPAFHHSAHHHHGAGHHHGGKERAVIDHCCALHAFFAGVLPPAVAMDFVTDEGRVLAPELSALGVGVPPVPLDRPPRRLR